MADFTLNFQSSGTANPFTNASLTEQLSAIKNVNGTGASAATNGTICQAVHNATYDGVIQSDVVNGATDASDYLGACVIVKSGGNALKGYVWYTDGATRAILAKLDGSGNPIDFSGTTFLYTPAAGDTLTLIYDKSSGNLTAKINGTTQETQNDTTYQAESSLAAGFLIIAANTNGSIIRSFSGTGLLSGVTITPPAGSETVTGNQPTVTPATNTVLTPFVARHRGIVIPERKIFLPARKAA